MTKQCGKCTQSLPLTDFHRSKANKDGLQKYCKVCSKMAVYESLDRKAERARIEPSTREDV